MSKLIETLKSGVREANKSGHEMTQDQLADIYFPNSDKVKKSEYPSVIRVIEKPRASAITPWIITSIAFLITALSLFTTKRVFVDIKIIDEKNPYLQMLQGQHGSVPDPEIGQGERVPLEDFSFEGAALPKSSKNKNMLTLVNSSIAPFSRAFLSFETPRDLSNSKIVFYAKGNKGGENIGVALKDRQNIQAFKGGTFYPFNHRLGTNWQKAEISLKNLPREFDAQGVSALRLEFGTKNAKNKPGDTLFIRDLEIAPL
jgi:hypothetical protein